MILRSAISLVRHFCMTGGTPQKDPQAYAVKDCWITLPGTLKKTSRSGTDSGFCAYSKIDFMTFRIRMRPIAACIYRDRLLESNSLAGSLVGAYRDDRKSISESTGDSNEGATAGCGSEIEEWPKRFPTPNRVMARLLCSNAPTSSSITLGRFGPLKPKL
jgi:hypothetical protein